MGFFKIIVLAVAGFAVLRGCAPRMEVVRPEPRPLGADLPGFEAGAPAPAAEEPLGVLGLRQALALSLMQNPELAVYSWEVRQGEARVLQAKLLPNPKAEVEFENIAGSDEFEGTKGLEATYALSQLVELGGKRSKRTRVAAFERDLAAWDFEAKRVEVFSNAVKAYLGVVAAQEQLRFMQELAGLAEQVLDTVSERADAGKVSPMEETRARVALANSRIELGRSRRALLAAKRSLANVWGSSSPAFESVEGELQTLSPIPALTDLEDRISNNPEIARWAAEMAQRSAILDLERANRIPNLTVSGGYRRFSETNDHAMVLGFSIPIPIFDRNQGAITEAEYGLRKAEEEQRAAEALVRITLAKAYQSLSAAYAEATALRDEVLPGAQSAFDAITEGYRQGKFGYLEALDAQRTLFDARGQYLKALVAYHSAVADVEGLIGEGLRPPVVHQEQARMIGEK